MNRSLLEMVRSDWGWRLQKRQTAFLLRILSEADLDPSYLSDLEGCGPVAHMEEAFRVVAGTRHILAVSSGTAAIHTTLLAAGIGPGDEVITTPYSWPQTVAPIVFLGAVPVFADIEPDTFHLDPHSVRLRLTSRTKAILVCHLFGHMVDMAELAQIASDNGIVLIADAAHAAGASLAGIPAGAWGNAACFSLGRGKLISGGEGGIIATNDDGLYERALYLSQHPERLKRWNNMKTNDCLFGLNYRLHPLAAVLALADLVNLNKKLSHRRAIFRAFREGVGSSIELAFQKGQRSGQHGAYGIPVTLHSGGDREKLCSRAQERGVPLRCGPIRIPLHLRTNKGFGPAMHFHPTHTAGACPIAEMRCAERELWAMSALDMDLLTVDEARRMGRTVAALLTEDISPDGNHTIQISRKPNFYPTIPFSIHKRKRIDSEVACRSSYNRKGGITT